VEPITGWRAGQTLHRRPTTIKPFQHKLSVFI
jgi:hypothetical protein